MEKKYWFFIDSYVHIEIKKNNVLLYNPYSGKIIEYKKREEIKKIINRLKYRENLQVILLEESDMRKPGIAEFVKTVKDHFMGDIIESFYSKGKPVQFPPLVKVQKDVKYLRKDSLRSTGEEIMDYLSEISIYLNDECSQDCNICSWAYRQVPFCTSRKRKHHELSLEQVRSIFEETKNCSSLEYRFLGGDIFSYSKFKGLLGLLKSKGNRKILFIHYLNLVKSAGRLRLFSDCKVGLKILVNSPFDQDKLKTVLDSSGKAGIEPSVCFTIKNEKEFEAAEEAASKLDMENFEFKALYDKRNLDFFRENIFVERDEIEQSRPSLKEIYSRGIVNAHNFGKLTILANGQVYANLNARKLGTLGQHSIYEIISKEMVSGKSWRKIRKYVSPCKSCTFERLCPPISNYNTVIGRYDLCHIYK